MDVLLINTLIKLSGYIQQKLINMSVEFCDYGNFKGYWVNNTNENHHVILYVHGVIYPLYKHFI